MKTLWDLIEPVVRVMSGRPRAALRAPAARRPGGEPPVHRSRPGSENRATTVKDGPGPAQRKYDAMVAELLGRHGIKIRKWRKNSSGIARLTQYRDGTVGRTIECPRVRGPMSAAIFLHEIGHHVIGFDVYKPRCLEEYHAWAFAIREMEARGLNVTDGVRKRMARSLKYAVGKAKRRGLKEVPAELAPFA